MKKKAFAILIIVILTVCMYLPVNAASASFYRYSGGVNSGTTRSTNGYTGTVWNVSSLGESLSLRIQPTSMSGIAVFRVVPRVNGTIVNGGNTYVSYTQVTSWENTIQCNINGGGAFGGTWTVNTGDYVDFMLFGYTSTNTNATQYSACYGAIYFANRSSASLVKPVATLYSNMGPETHTEIYHTGIYNQSPVRGSYVNKFTSINQTINLKLTVNNWGSATRILVYGYLPSGHTIRAYFDKGTSGIIVGQPYYISTTSRGGGNFTIIDPFVPFMNSGNVMEFYVFAETDNGVGFDLWGNLDWSFWKYIP